MSLESKDNLVVFEAKVLIDGECTADLVFSADAHWPQIIETTTGNFISLLEIYESLIYRSSASKDNKPGQLRFPAFHAEMLSQTWVLPHDSTGRIKVLIAEGVSHGPPSSKCFERTRSLVVFSFLHTPLHILEDAGIAWPNPGMFYQMSYSDSNPLSPQKAKTADPEGHAHSPRRGALHHASGASANIDATVAPHSLSNGISPTKMGMLPPPFKAHRHPAGDPFLSQYHYHDSFNSIGEPPFPRISFQGNTRHTSSSGDVSMKDAPTRSTTSDEVMADYIHPLSPTSRLRRYPLNDHSRSFSSEGYHFPLLAPQDMQSRSPPRDRQVSKESLRGPRMQSLFDQFEVQCESDVNLPEHSQFTEMIDAMSPRKGPGDMQYQSTSTKVSSAAKTPTASTRISNAAEARSLSYSGKVRAMPQTSLDMPKPNHPRVAAKVVAKTRSKPSRVDAGQPGITVKGTCDAAKVVTASPTTKIKSRKENQMNKVGHEDAKTLNEVAPAGANLVQEAENARANPSSGIKNKKRRLTSDKSLGEVLAASETSMGLVSDEISNIDAQGLPNKINDFDDLTPEGILTRAPLGSLSNKR